MTSVLGILGGTFDPIHFGHLGVASEVRDAAGLASVLLVPAGDPPHRDTPAASGVHRLAMAELAIAGHPGLTVDPCEVRRDGPSYTVLTLAELHARQRGRTLALIVGADAFLELPTWHRWRELFKLAHLIVVARPGAPLRDRLMPVLAAEWASRLRHGPAALLAAPAGAIVEVPITARPISATMIRNAFTRGEPESVRGLLPPAVFAYIARNRLYQP